MQPFAVFFLTDSERNRAAKCVGGLAQAVARTATFSEQRPVAPAQVVRQVERFDLFKEPCRAAVGADRKKCRSRVIDRKRVAEPGGGQRPPTHVCGGVPAVGRKLPVERAVERELRDVAIDFGGLAERLRAPFGAVGAAKRVGRRQVELELRLRAAPPLPPSCTLQERQRRLEAPFGECAVGRGDVERRITKDRTAEKHSVAYHALKRYLRELSHA